MNIYYVSLESENAYWGEIEHSFNSKIIINIINSNFKVCEHRKQTFVRPLFDLSHSECTSSFEKVSVLA